MRISVKIHATIKTEKTKALSIFTQKIDNFVKCFNMLDNITADKQTPRDSPHILPPLPTARRSRTIEARKRSTSTVPIMPILFWPLPSGKLRAAPLKTR